MLEQPRIGAGAVLVSALALSMGGHAAPGPAVADVPDSERIAAARATAESSTNACSTIRPFYWEVGDAGASKVAGSLRAPDSNVRYTARIPINVASASKWVYGAYVAQVRNGQLDAEDRRFLQLKSGYISFVGCSSRQTVGTCLEAGTNGNYTPSADGKFFYGDGHMQKHAVLDGLADEDKRSLATLVRARIGTDVELRYGFPVLASGLFMSPDAFAHFLRKLLNGTLQLSALLGADPVCTNPATCGIQHAIYTPVPEDESWDYSIAHWVESDPVVGDGAYSSPGGLGFYPWIDASKSYYGLVARIAEDGAFTSVQCGRLIRKAWLTGEPQ
jgi:hypothetical protein